MLWSLVHSDFLEVELQCGPHADVELSLTARYVALSTVLSAPYLDVCDLAIQASTTNQSIKNGVGLRLGDLVTLPGEVYRLTL